MHRVGFEPMIPVLMLAKAGHALDSAATVIDKIHIPICNNNSYLSTLTVKQPQRQSLFRLDVEVMNVGF
jgi:hypothetical protein